MREMRFLVERRGTVRALFKVAVSNKDASLYLFPYGQGGRYFYGRQSLGEHEVRKTFSYADQFDTEGVPKLSIHQSGRVHVYYGRDRLAGPLWTLPLPEWRGQHIDSVVPDSLDSLAPYTREIKTEGPEFDCVIESDDCENLRVVVYCNGWAPEFVDGWQAMLTLQRPSLERPIYFGFMIFPERKLSQNGGITVLAGWKPDQPDQGVKDTIDFLFIRAR